MHTISPNRRFDLVVYFCGNQLHSITGMLDKILHEIFNPLGLPTNVGPNGTWFGEDRNLEWTVDTRRAPIFGVVIVGSASTQRIEKPDPYSQRAPAR